MYNKRRITYEDHRCNIQVIFQIFYKNSILKFNISSAT